MQYLSNGPAGHIDQQHGILFIIKQQIQSRQEFICLECSTFNSIRAVVDTVARSATSDEIDEPGLDTFRDRIRTKVNSVIGRKAIEEVVVSDFRYFHL